MSGEQECACLEGRIYLAKGYLYNYSSETDEGCGWALVMKESTVLLENLEDEFQQDSLHVEVNYTLQERVFCAQIVNTLDKVNIRTIKLL
ncbi:hypothetical protein QWY31_10055 [Cytophagales bacterium LB-30]|uniref:Uncharacterized protein n=1 Tax=Shiella aurantiaca TaxID=3058365 RepID=A0ABT8F635_9BACT|nr:hypothetical protein [Shiella aurantiaca]MDN4165848.1 hypothetical protein [Shiella aurantiaca]